MPSGNSAAARVLQHLAQLTGEAKWRGGAGRTAKYLAGAMEGISLWTQLCASDDAGRPVSVKESWSAHSHPAVAGMNALN